MSISLYGHRLGQFYRGGVMSEQSHSVNVPKSGSVKNVIFGRYVRYVGWLVVAIKLVFSAFKVFLNLSVSPGIYLPTPFVFSGIVWILFGLSIVQAGRWLERGDNVRIAAGKLLQVLGAGAVILMLAIFPLGYSDSSKAGYYSGFVLGIFAAIGITVLLAGGSMIFMGFLLRRETSKKALIPVGIITGALVLVSFRLLY